MEYNDEVATCRAAFAKLLATLSTLEEFAQNPYFDWDSAYVVRVASGEIADQLVLLLRQFDRMGFVSIVDEEDSPRFDSEIIDGKPKLIISISGSNVEHGARQ